MEIDQFEEEIRIKANEKGYKTLSFNKGLWLSQAKGKFSNNLTFIKLILIYEVIKAWIL
jgi:hypothetical protein